MDLLCPVVFGESARTVIQHCDADGQQLVGGQLEQFLKELRRCSFSGLAEDYFDLHKRIPSMETPLAKLQHVREMFEAEVSEWARAGTPAQLLVLDEERKQSLDPELLRAVQLELVGSPMPVRVIDAPNGPIALCIRQMFHRDVPQPQEESKWSANTGLKLPRPFR